VLGDMLELGPTEAQLHADVGRWCAELRLDAVVAFGPRSAATAEAAAAAGLSATHTEDDIDAAVAAVHAAMDGAPAGAVLVKGSRGMRLERVVDRLATP